MSLTLFARRAALLGVALAPAGCDLVSFARNDPPVFEQTWQIPVVETSMGVADLLPPGNVVTILPDSSGFALTIAGTNISRVVGSDCAQCVSLNGTNAPKPQFILNAFNSTPLPTSVTAAVITAGTLQLNLVNNMSFDPLYVNTSSPADTAQGYMLIVVRSGSQVLARDSVRGAAAVAGTVPFCSAAAGAICNAPFVKNGGTLNRTIPINTGTATTSLTVDVTINSPLGDHSEFINANGTLDATASVPSMTVGSVSLSIVNKTFNPQAGDTISLEDMPFPSDKIQSAILSMDITNPFAVTGTLAVDFAYGPLPGDVVTKNITLPSGSGLQTVTLTNADIQLLAGKNVALTVSGTVNSAAPVPVTPTQKIVIDNKMAVKFWTSNPGGI